MASKEFIIKRNDTLPPLASTITLRDGSVVNLTGMTAMFLMRKEPNEGTVKVSAPATILDHVGGRVQYEWAEGDTDTSGKYRGEFQFTGPDGIFTAPNDSYIPITIKDDLGPDEA